MGELRETAPMEQKQESYLAGRAPNLACLDHPTMNNLIKSFFTFLVISSAMFIGGCRATEQVDQQRSSESETSPSPAPTQVEDQTSVEPTPEEDYRTDWAAEVRKPDYGLNTLDEEYGRRVIKAFGRIEADDVRSLDFWRLPYHEPFGNEIPYTKAEIKIDTSFGDIDGDGKEEVFVLMDQVPQGSGSFTWGILLGVEAGKLKVLAVMHDGQRFASEGPGELLGGHITNGQVRVFRWAWDDLYSPKDDSKRMNDIVYTTVYKLKKNRLVSTSVTGIFVKDFPIGYWPKEPNIMSAKREAEFIKKAKIGNVDLKNPIPRTAGN